MIEKPFIMALAARYLDDKCGKDQNYCFNSTVFAVAAWVCCVVEICLSFCGVCIEVFILNFHNEVLVKKCVLIVC